MILKQSALYSRKFLMVLSSDSKTGATGKTVTVMLSKGAGAAGTTAAGAVTELDSTNLPGMYQVALTAADTGVVGDLGFDCTGSGCDHTTFIDTVQTQVFTDLSMNANGQVLIGSNIKQNQAATIEFPMTLTSNGNLASGLTVTAQRSLGGAGFSPCVNAPAEIPTSSGVYSLLLAASDTNAASGIVLLTATGANPVLYQFVTQP